MLNLNKYVDKSRTGLYSFTQGHVDRRAGPKDSVSSAWLYVAQVKEILDMPQGSKRFIDNPFEDLACVEQSGWHNRVAGFTVKEDGLVDWVGGEENGGFLAFELEDGDLPVEAKLDVAGELVLIPSVDGYVITHDGCVLNLAEITEDVASIANERGGDEQTNVGHQWERQEVADKLRRLADWIEFPVVPERTEADVERDRQRIRSDIDRIHPNDIRAITSATARLERVPGPHPPIPAGPRDRTD